MGTGMSATPTNQPRFIATIFPQIERNGIPEILTGIEAACGEAGLLATFHNSRNLLATEAALIRQAVDSGCAGLVLYPCFSPLGNATLYSSLALRGFPLVMIDRSIDFLGLPLFACDNEASMAMLCRHVIGRGHRRIAFLCNSIETISSEQERFRGYGRALVEAGIPLDPDLVWRTAPGIGLDTGQTLPSWPERLLQAGLALDQLLALPDPPSCVMAVNDVLAMSLQKAALARGLAIPGDLAVTGFDNSDAVDHIDVPLTTVAQPFRQIGREAVELIARGLCQIDAGTKRGASQAGLDGTPSVSGGRRIMGELVLRQSV